MEVRSPSNTRTSEDLVLWSGDGHGFGQEIRSYTCSFCKRGFSNAQALGGHMNIHRKDRARLRESSEETLNTIDTTKSSTVLDQTEVQSSSEEKGDGALKRPWTFKEEENSENPRKKDHGVNVKSPSASSSSAHHVSLSLLTEVDLELRLGMDSQESSRKL